MQPVRRRCVSCCTRRAAAPSLVLVQEELEASQNPCHSRQEELETKPLCDWPHLVRMSRGDRLEAASGVTSRREDDATRKPFGLSVLRRCIMYKVVSGGGSTDNSPPNQGRRTLPRSPSRGLTRGTPMPSTTLSTLSAITIWGLIRRERLRQAHARRPRTLVSLVAALLSRSSSRSGSLSTLMTTLVHKRATGEVPEQAARVPKAEV